MQLLVAEHSDETSLLSMFIDQVLTLEQKKILLPSNLLAALTIEAHKTGVRTTRSEIYF